MSTAATNTVPTPEQYLAMERWSEVKHEYYLGQIITMTGASRAHNLITGNIAHVVWNQLVDRPSELYASDMRVSLGSGIYVYPDVVIVRGEPRFLDETFDTLLNPTVILEVLSPTTKDFDRGSKFAYYRQIPSLREFVAVAQDQVWIEHHRRVDDEWKLVDLISRTDTLRLESIGCQIPLSEVYAKVAVADRAEMANPS
jgi:Uma2 family endonuclease